MMDDYEAYFPLTCKQCEKKIGHLAINYPYDGRNGVNVKTMMHRNVVSTIFCEDCFAEIKKRIDERGNSNVELLER